MLMSTCFISDNEGELDLFGQTVALYSYKTFVVLPTLYFYYIIGYKIK